MPQFTYSKAMTANGTVNPLQDKAWTYRRLPARAHVQVFMQSTDANIVASIVIGSDLQRQESPVSSGATAGEFPSQLPLLETYMGDAGDEINIQARETAGGTPTLNLLCIVTFF
jgi:hypothetical protein